MPRTTVDRNPRAIRPTWRTERHLWRTGAKRVAGVDEVGRGPLAGPVVAAAVVIPHTGSGHSPRARWIGRLRDSKLVSPAQREELAAIIRERTEWGVGVVSPQVVDQINILRATRLAMHRAVQAMSQAPDCLIVDGREVVDGGLEQVAVVDGDALCISVSAASILAKVVRDRMMCELDQVFPGYGLAVNKGYATPAHRAALARLGYSNIHRLSFAPVRRAVMG
ncbi:MAG: ribonuclease HII [Dehalococcoidia bacterium]|nr:ribonuclease HII [Dehalococcoidia bacterium]